MIHKYLPSCRLWKHMNKVSETLLHDPNLTRLKCNQISLFSVTVSFHVLQHMSGLSGISYFKLLEPAAADFSSSSLDDF